MRHNICLTGKLVRLRPVTDGDAETIVALRTARGDYLNKGAATVDEQLRWLSAYYQRAGDYYFAVERLSNGRCEGFTAICDVNEETREAEGGRMVMHKGTGLAVECMYLRYRIAFECLHLVALRNLTITSNTRALSFHRSYGLPMKKILKNHYRIDGIDYDAAEQVVDLDFWKELEPHMQRLIDKQAAKSV